jgi:hypothetical protein
MRFSDLVESTVEQGDIANDLEELITRAKARGYTKLNTPSVLSKLQSMGYSIDMISLKSLLKNIKSVGAASDTEVTLDTAVPDSPNTDADKDKETVSKLASKQLKKRMP